MAAPSLSIIHALFGSAFHVSQIYHKGHDGIDIAAKEGTPIRAVASGTVEYARDARTQADKGAHGWAMGGGNVVNIDIGGDKAMQYAHMQRFVVHEGEHVKKGQIIGYVGRTGGKTASGAFGGPGAEFVGAHVHFGLWNHKTNHMDDPTNLLIRAVTTDVGKVTGGTTDNSPGKAADDVIAPAADIANVLPEFLASIGKTSSDPITQDDINKFVQFLQKKKLVPAGSPNVNPLVGAFENTMQTQIGQPWGGIGQTLKDAAPAAGDPFGIQAAVATLGKGLGKIAGLFIGLALILTGIWLYSKGQLAGTTVEG